MTLIVTEKQADKYLDQFKLSENQYIIGNQQNGITIYKQQVRALNIFYSLYLSKKISKETSLAVIGGGTAGMTFSAAAMRSKINTLLFEKEDELIPIQSRCNGRLIHPNIYDWPMKGSTKNVSELPVLNWKEGKTNLFCDDIINQFNEIKAEAGGNFEEILNCGKILNISINDTGAHPGKNFSIETEKKGIRFADLIIYAVGYGLEVSPDNDTPIYWRNLGLEQANVKKEKYLISGTGDGALMDLFTLKIKKFSYSDIINNFKSQHEHEFLERQLQEFRVWYHTNPQPLSFMWDRFSSLNPLSYQEFYNKLQLNDTEVVLHSRHPLTDIFNLDRVSLFNGFLLFVLWQANGGKKSFDFVEGELEFDGKHNSTLKGTSNKFLNYVHYFRYGSDRKSVLTSIPGLNENFEKQNLFNKQKQNTKDGMVYKKWTNESLTNIFKKAHLDEIERVSSNALPILENYTNTINSFFVSRFGKKSGNYRIAVHKVIYHSDNLRFQQITPYAGSQKITFKGGYSKIKSANIGSVGYSIRTGKPSLITRTDKESESSFREYLKFFGLKDVYNKVKKRKSFFTMPILVLNSNDDSEILNQESVTVKGVCLILYIDSDQNDFFDSKSFEIILASTKAFITSFSDCFEKEQFLMLQFNQQLSPPQISTIDQKIENGVFFRNDDKNFKKFVSQWEQDQRLLNFFDFYTFSHEKVK